MCSCKKVDKCQKINNSKLINRKTILNWRNINKHAHTHSFNKIKDSWQDAFMHECFKIWV